jgi:3-deoxy-7-phosphoheptulonate synthase
MRDNINTKCYLTLKENKNVRSKFHFMDAEIKNKVLMIAGPCSVEKEDITLRIAEELAKKGINFFRAGAYKPRSCPYSFQGLGEKGLKILEKVGNEFDLKIVTEVVDESTLESVAQVADILQIGSRNMFNYSLLKKVGKQKKPVLLKRGMSATLKEYLMAAEYIIKEGNTNIILCERGIRTFDPSHAAGDRNLVIPLAKAAITVGADGLIIETHINPDQAWSDSKQTISIEQLSLILDFLKDINIAA